MDIMDITHYFVASVSFHSFSNLLEFIFNKQVVARLHSIGSRVVAIIQLYVWVNDWGCVTLCTAVCHMAWAQNY
ncbi:hypothetical protein EB796_023864 [Bugula neritina]|uniref:Uncharacterized protein n=1 Tax=Bugula neritina TaxID=10212 RepID=A0A7J7IVF1_BUGNE|nr:hypothetical protein EB796_023864 [Bugula neritina]